MAQETGPYEKFEAFVLKSDSVQFASACLGRKSLDVQFCCFLCRGCLARGRVGPGWTSGFPVVWRAGRGETIRCRLFPARTGKVAAEMNIAALIGRELSRPGARHTCRQSRTLEEQKG